MRLAALPLVAGAFLSLALASSAGAAPAPARQDFELPGRVLAAAASPDGATLLATLEDGGEVKLWRLDLAAAGPRLVPVAGELPTRVARLDEDERSAPGLSLATLRGERGGSAPLLVSLPGAVWLLAGGVARQLPAGAGFALAPHAAGEGTLPAPLTWPLALARAGELMILASPAASPLRVELPVTAQPRPWGLELSLSPVRQLAPPVGGTLVVVGPQKVGERRLRTLLVDAAGVSTEAWSLLPEGERLLSGRPLALDGELLLAVTAAPAGMLAEQRLHLFRLAADRSRRGSGPVASVQLQVRHWLAPGVTAADRDGDGHDDLVVVEPRGLGGGELTVSTMRGLGRGRLAPAGKRVDWDDAWGSWSYGTESTGDGRGDLVRLSRGKVTLHAGEPGERAVRGAAEWSVELGGGAGTRVLAIGTGGTTMSDGERGTSERGGGRARGNDEDDDEDDDDGEEDDGFGPATLVVQDLDGDRLGEVLVWRRRDTGGSQLVVLWRRRQT